MEPAALLSRQSSGVCGLGVYLSLWWTCPLSFLCTSISDEYNLEVQCHSILMVKEQIRRVTKEREEARRVDVTHLFLLAERTTLSLFYLRVPTIQNDPVKMTRSSNEIRLFRCQVEKTNNRQSLLLMT